MTDRIQKAIEDKQYSCGIFLDLSKAFDTVDHQILLHKLEAYGIRGIVNDRFKSYLHNRRQFTTIGRMRSEEKLLNMAYHKEGYWDHCSFSCTLMISKIVQTCLILIYLQTIRICFLRTKIQNILNNLLMFI